MYEAFARNKLAIWDPKASLSPATGIIQWMLNSAWPSNVWNLYDYYLVPSAAFASAKKACGEPLHAMLSYSDASVWVTNARNAPAGGGGGGVRVEAFALSGAPLFNATYALPVIAPGGGARVGAGPAPAAMRAALGGGRTYLARLTLLSASGAPLGTPNTYARGTDEDALDWAASEWFTTPCSAFANLTELRALPQVPLSSAATPVAPGLTRVDLALPAGAAAVAFFVGARLVDAAGQDVAPVLWTDNYATLRPGEGLSYSASYDGAATAQPTRVIVTTFNDEAGAGAGRR